MLCVVWYRKNYFSRFFLRFRFRFVDAFRRFRYFLNVLFFVLNDVLYLYDVFVCGFFIILNEFLIIFFV